MVWGGVATGGVAVGGVAVGGVAVGGQTVNSDLLFFFLDGETDKKIETDKPPYLSNEN